MSLSSALFCIKPYCSRACSRTIFYTWARLVYQTSLKLSLKFGLFINKQTWTGFLSSQTRVVHERLGSFTALGLTRISLVSHIYYCPQVWTYCLKVWNKALNQSRVEASSVLRKAESVYYPQAIHISSSSGSKADAPLEVANPEKSSP